MRLMSIKNAQFDIHKLIIWPKKSGKCRQKWNKESMDVKIDPKNFNTLVNTMLVFYVN
jgi:hypothetical protein